MYLGSSRRAAAGIFTVAVGASSLSAFAQGITTGSISGTISDPTGALLPGAQVVATRLATKTQYKTTTDARGSFFITNAGIGAYSLAVTSPGFSLLTLNNVLVDANKVTDLGSKQVAAGSASETVEVSSTSALLETSEAQLTTTFNTQQLTELPVAGGFDELALLIPGVVNTHANNFSNTNGVGFSSNGLRGRSNNFEIDGQSNNDNSVGGPQFFFSNDEALAELQVISNDFSAQYGRNAGTIVNYITKSGTNQIHGSAFYRYSGVSAAPTKRAFPKDRSLASVPPGRIRLRIAAMRRLFPVTSRTSGLAPSVRQSLKTSSSVSVPLTSRTTTSLAPLPPVEVLPSFLPRPACKPWLPLMPTAQRSQFFSSLVLTTSLSAIHGKRLQR